MITHDKKYLSELFRLGLLCDVDLVEAPLKRSRWEMLFETRDGRTIYAETRRGEPKTFASIEAAKKYAADLGFKKMELCW